MLYSGETTLTHSQTFEAVCGERCSSDLFTRDGFGTFPKYRGENTPGAVLGQQSTFIPKHTSRSHSISLSQGWYDLVLAANTEARQRGLREDLLLCGSISGTHS